MKTLHMVRVESKETIQMLKYEIEMGNAETEDVDKVVSLANPKDEIAD
jgi:hypothetical protein